MKPKLLVTGGAGFIGNAILDKIYDTYDVVILDNLSAQVHGNNYQDSYLYNRAKNKGTIIIGDIRDKKVLLKALEGVDFIIHLASETGTGQSMYELSRYSEVNVTGLANILEAIQLKGNTVKKIVLASSRSIYGEGMYFCNSHGVIVPDQRKLADISKKDFDVKCPFCSHSVESLPTTESSHPRPLSFYAFTKLAQEEMLKVMCPTMNLNYTIFRYQNVFGPGQSLNNPYTGILSIFSKNLQNNQDINIFEDGLESRDFIHVKDVAEYTVSAITNDKTNGEIYNVGSGESISVIRVAETLKNLLKSSSKINVSGDFRIGDIRHNKADMTKTVDCFGFKPKYSFENGILEFSSWVKDELADTKKSKMSASDESFDELLARGMLLKGTKLVNS